MTYVGLLLSVLRESPGAIASFEDLGKSTSEDSMPSGPERSADRTCSRSDMLDEYGLNLDNFGGGGDEFEDEMGTSGYLLAEEQELYDRKLPVKKDVAQTYANGVGRQIWLQEHRKKGRM